MADIKSKKERSQNMAKIRSKDTEPEIWLRKKLFERGYRYRKNVKNIPGHPDIWLKKYNTAIFVHGCFWHRHNGCKYAYMPKSRVEFWKDKFERNILRDALVKEELKGREIRQLIVWECTVKEMHRSVDTEQRIIDRIEKFLSSEDKKYLEL